MLNDIYQSIEREEPILLVCLDLKAVLHLSKHLTLNTSNLPQKPVTSAITLNTTAAGVLPVLPVWQNSGRLISIFICEHKNI
jgi:hypothetical protein